MWGTYDASNLQDYTAAYSEVAVIYFDTETEFILSFGNAQHLSAGYIYKSFATGRTLLVQGLRANCRDPGSEVAICDRRRSGRQVFR